jgi:hypothetical protein
MAMRCSCARSWFVIHLLVVVQFAASATADIEAVFQAYSHTVRANIDGVKRHGITAFLMDQPSVHLQIKVCCVWMCDVSTS